MQLRIHWNVFRNMLFDRQATPLRLAALTAFGSVVSATAFSSVPRFHDSLPALVCCLILAPAGLGLVYYAPLQLRNGMENDRWSEEELQPLRRVVEHPGWTAMVLVLVLAMLASVLVKVHHKPFFWTTFVLLQPLSQLSNALRKPIRPAKTMERLDWSKVPPLQSDHWGER